MILDDQSSGESSSSLGLVAAACLIALGISAGGYFIGYALKTGLSHFHTPHIISVKGLAERQVKADLALWPLRFVTASNDLAAAQAKIDGDQKAVTDFLKAQGLPDAAVTAQRTDVVDLLAREFRNENLRDTRYIVYGNVMIRSDNADLVQTISRNMNDLVKAGVVFTTEGVGPAASLTPYYLFTKLNDVKPGMLTEATHSAFAAAQQIARDSNDQLGDLARANQGTFSILPGDPFPGASEETQIIKTLRVVSTFEYALGN
jgi:hypothetical protein